eukprot:s3918_g4.t1
MQLSAKTAAKAPHDACSRRTFRSCCWTQELSPPQPLEPQGTTKPLDCTAAKAAAADVTDIAQLVANRRSVPAVLSKAPRYDGSVVQASDESSVSASNEIHIAQLLLHGRRVSALVFPSRRNDRAVEKNSEGGVRCAAPILADAAHPSCRLRSWRLSTSRPIDPPAAVQMRLHWHAAIARGTAAMPPQRMSRRVPDRPTRARSRRKLQGSDCAVDGDDIGKIIRRTNCPKLFFALGSHKAGLGHAMRAASISLPRPQVMMRPSARRTGNARREAAT